MTGVLSKVSIACCGSMHWRECFAQSELSNSLQNGSGVPCQAQSKTPANTPDMPRLFVAGASAFLGIVWLGCEARSRLLCQAPPLRLRWASLSGHNWLRALLMLLKLCVTAL